MLRDGSLIATLAGSAVAFDELDLGDGAYSYEIVAVRDALSTASAPCEATVSVGPPAVTGLSCTLTGSDVLLEWTNGAADYDDLEIVRNGSVVATLAGSATSFDDLAVGTGSFDYEVRPLRSGLLGAPVACAVSVGTAFKRGDADGNGAVFGLLDALFILQFAFSGGATPTCMDAADADGNGAVFGLLDALYLLQFSFSNGPAPPTPGPDECGVDPGGIGCETASAGC